MGMKAEAAVVVVGEEEEGGSGRTRLGTSTFAQATFNCVSLLLGLGILSSPYAVAQSGWAGVMISNLMALTYGYTAYLMIKCMEAHPRCGTYQDVAREAFGKRAATIIDTLFYMEILGTLLGYCISIGDNLIYLLPHFGGDNNMVVGLVGRRNVMMIIACVFILPTVWLQDLRALSYTSIWSFGTTLLLLLAMLLCATVNRVGFHHHLSGLHLRGVPIAAGLYAFTYGGTTVFPSIYKSMKDPSRFSQVVVVSFVLSAACVGGMGAAGAAMFGEGTASQVTLSMPRQLSSTKVVLWATVLNPLLKFALVLSPVTAALQRQLRRRCAAGPSAVLLLDTLLRSLLLALIAALAMALPYFNYIVALVGSTVTVAICLVLPCAFYLKLLPRSSYPTLALIALVLALSTLVAIYGTLVSFGGLINSSKEHHA